MDWTFGNVVRGGVALGALLILAALLRVRTEQEFTGAPRAVDGDTLVLSGERLRLLGIDAPELAQECMERTGAGERPWPCGAAAKSTLERIVSRGLTTCTGRDRDRYHRLLVHCRVRGEDLNARLVREGAAISTGEYRAEEEEARNDGAGVWRGPFQRPAAWRQAHPREDGDAAPR